MQRADCIIETENNTLLSRYLGNPIFKKKNDCLLSLAALLMLIVGAGMVGNYIKGRWELVGN